MSDGQAEDHAPASQVPVLHLDARAEPLREWIGGLWRYRSILFALARKDFRVRYKRAAFGVLWAVALPLVQAIAMAFIFSRVGRFGSGSGYSYAGFVLAGIVAWTYVSASVPASTAALISGAGMTDKVWFPRAILTLVPAASNLASLAIATVIVLVALPVLGESYSPGLLLLVPAILLAIAFVSSLGMLLGALEVYFRDVQFMVSAVMLVWFYVTPIIYPADALGSAGRWLDFNPLTGIVGLFQRATVDAPVPSARALIVSIVTTIVLCVVAVGFHRRHDRLFVDLL